MRPALRIVLWLAGAGLLALVAPAYLDPHLAVTIANQIKACF